MTSGERTVWAAEFARMMSAWRPDDRPAVKRASKRASALVRALRAAGRSAGADEDMRADIADMLGVRT
jgi:hypothetical protein